MLSKLLFRQTRHRRLYETSVRLPEEDGIKQAERQWSAVLCQTFTDKHGMEQCRADPCVYRKIVQNLPKIFRWPEMCFLGKILAHDFQMAAVTKIFMRRDHLITPLLSSGDKQKTLETQKRTR